MTGIRLQAMGDTSNPFGLWSNPPVKRGLACLNFSGADARFSQVNRSGFPVAGRRAGSVLGMVDGIEDGLPQTHFVTDHMRGCDYLNCIEYEVAETESMTFIFAAKPENANGTIPDINVSTTRPIYIGYQLSSNHPVGMSVFVGGTGNVRLTAEFLVSGVSTTVNCTRPGYTGTQLNQLRMWAARIEAGVGMTIRDITAGTPAIFVANTNSRVLSGRNLRMGAGFSASGRSGFYCGSAHQVALNTSEEDDQAEFMATILKDEYSITGLVPGV